ncbi:MAG: hypothetical protein J7L82_02300 [Staphylothermus sp.]|nr:hypothetical protein [Staphylothermus sp.]
MKGLVRESNFVIEERYDVVIYKNMLNNEYVIRVYDVEKNKVVYSKNTPVLPSTNEFMKLIKELKKKGDYN